MAETKDRYEILALLGAGGMGQVYRANDSVLGREVALKILRGDDPLLFARAQREARHQSRVNHENVGHIYEVGKLDEKPFVAMQLVEGRDLGAAMAELSLFDKVDILRQVAEGVQAAHSTGLIHRDIKPGNILVEERDSGWHAWVVDFGLAVDPSQPGMSATGEMVGTATYMSPEQIRGERSQLDRRSDVYALGATLFEVLTGRGPFVGENPVQVLMQALHDEAPPLRRVAKGLPFELEIIVAKCLEKDPERRYASARLLADDLDHFLKGEPVLAQPPSRVYRWKKGLIRHRFVATVIATATLLILGSLAVAFRARWQAGQTARYAREFGREAEQVATRLKIAQLVPRHDLSAEKQVLAERMARLEARSRRLGGLALRPGLIAVARAQLALGQLDEARLRLDEAQSLGHDDPELARLRGRTLFLLYRQRLASIRRLDPRWRDVELVRERESLLEPALDAFSAVDDLDDLDQARVAMLADDLHSAEALVTAAVAASPWDHEPKLLLADILAESAQGSFESGAMDDTVELLARAREVLRQAREIGRSDPQVYRQECSLAELRFEVALVGSLPAPEDPERFLEPCDLAVATDTSSALSLARRAGLRRHLASRALRQGADPLEHVERAIEDGEGALALDPRLMDALYHTGVAYSLRANHAEGSDREISDDLARASELLERCVQEAPKFVPCRVSLGVNGLEHGIHLDNQGLGSEETFLGAIAAFEEAIALAPSLAVLHNDLAYTSVYLAEVSLTDGIDPGPRLAAARESLRRSIELAPDYASARLSLGESYRVEARYLYDQGLDPTPAVEKAAKAYGRALELDPDRFYAALLSFQTQLLGVDYRLEHALGRERLLEPVRAALDRAEGIGGESLPCEQAEFLIRKASATNSESTCREAQALASRSGCPLTESRAWGRLAAWEAQRGNPPAASLRSGLEALDRYSIETPRDPEAAALRAKLELEIARSTRDPLAARAAAERALTAWSRALELRPLAAPLWAESVEASRLLAN
ncbi:MAG: protein kinase [Thermoanaerobaculia bacterium]|nr:protein kinase [Thermoanaerobaculia bacterium]